MKMYKKNRVQKTVLAINNSYEGEPLEIKIERMINNKEKIEGESPLIFTERSEGVKAAYDIRTDRFEVAVEGMDKVHKSIQARREEKAAKKQETKVVEMKPENGGAESTQGTNN